MKMLSAIALLGLLSLVPDLNAQNIGDRHKRLSTLGVNETSWSPYSVQKLTDEVVSFPRSFSLNSETESMYKTILVKGETDFLNGKHPGITEEEIVMVHNHIADQLSLPEHAKTSVEQVHHLRSKLATAEPGFIKPEGKMSPLQTAHLMSVLFSQKMLNPNYQEMPSEWQPDRRRLLDLAGTGFQNPKGRETLNAMKSGMSNMSLTDGMRLWRDSLHTLHLGGNQ